MRFLRAVIVATCFVFVCSPAKGQLSITSSSPITPQIRYGSTITYSLTGKPTGGGSVTDVQWSYQMTAPCTSGWSAATDTGTTLNITYAEGTAGTFTVKAHVTIMTGYQQTTQDVTQSFTVLPPDDIQLPQAPNNTVTIPPGQLYNFNFPVLCKGKVVGALQGVAKENLTNQVLLGKKLPDRLLGGKAPTLTIQGVSIQDAKGTQLNAGGAQAFANLAVGDTLYSCKQTFSILMYNAYCILRYHG